MKTRLSLNLNFTLAALLIVLCIAPVYALEKNVVVQTAGTLSSLVPENEKMTITKLKVSGPLNGSDILFIREMMGRSQYGSKTEGKLTDLDISGASIVAGGSSYCYSSNFTENDVIGANMFGELDNLQKIALPKNVIRLDLCAFYRCYELEALTIPNTVKTIVSNAFFQLQET